MAEVFVSYARENRRAATRVAAALREQGFKVWQDDELPAHRSYSDVIEQQLREAKAVLVLWSKAAAGSQWVRAEADFARNARKLVQARLDATMPPLPFNQIECADLKSWRGSADHPGWHKLATSVAMLAGGPPAGSPKKPAARPRWLLPVAAAFVALVILAAALLIPRLTSRGDEKRPVLAVLPFESPQGKNDGLVAGIWEDTRQQLSLNPQLLVLGPHSSVELADKGTAAARRTADYLLEGNVRSAGNRIRVNVSLTRSRDGAQIWSERFDRSIDDVFAMQSAIAAEIEGRIRGRLAERGGVRPENIATSGEVYALYSNATAKLRKGNPQEYFDAYRQLQDVVRRDANFAPGWAALSVSGWLVPFDSNGAEIPRGISEAQARRAVALAPNLASGHAALGLALGQGPAAQQELRRALQLDPNDIEALTWLAATLNPYTQQDELLKLWTRAVEIEPLWGSAALGRVYSALNKNDRASALAELRRVEQSGDPLLALIIRMEILRSERNLSGAAKIALNYYQRAPSESRQELAQSVANLLMQLGLVDQADSIWNPKEFVAVLHHRDPRALSMIEQKMPPRQFWRIDGLQTQVGRLALNKKRPELLLHYYRAAASSADQFAVDVVGPGQLPRIAPTLAVALSQSGSAGEGERLLELAEGALGDAPAKSAWARALLGRIRAAQDRRAEAVQLLASAVSAGWLPDYFFVTTDLAEDPALARLSGDPRFDKLRQQMLDFVAGERSKLGPVVIE